MNDLKGARILVTRPFHQADKICHQIEHENGIAVRFPTLEIVTNENCSEKAKILANLSGFDWVVFISANAVNFALIANDGKIQTFKPTKIAAIGQATANALELVGIQVDLKPAYDYNSEALLALPQMQLQIGQRCLIVRGEGGREELADDLRKKGVIVEYLEVYKRIIPNIDTSPVISMLENNQLDFVTITSGEALKNLLCMIGNKHHQQLFAIPVIVMSNRIRDIAIGMGFHRVSTANNPSDSAILDTIRKLLNED